MIERGMTMEAYLARPGAHATALWRLVSQSAAHYRYAEDHPESPTEAMILGTALHVRVLEPEAWAVRYLVCDGPVNPKTSRPYGRDTKAWAEWRSSQAAGIEIVSEADGERLRAMAEQILYDDTIRGFLEMPAESELSLFWTDPETGIACKGRIDRLIQGVQIMDLKTCASAKPDAVKHAADKYGYWFQLAFYRWGLGLITSCKPLRPIIVASEKEPPYKASLCRLTDVACDEGERQFQSALRRLAECERSRHWPGYEGVYEIEPSKYVRETIFD